MTLKLRAFDAANYLDDPQSVAAFLDEACKGGDANEVGLALGAVARAKGFNELARTVGISGPGLRKALSGDGNPTLETLVKVAEALGLRLSFAPKAAAE